MIARAAARAVKSSSWRLFTDLASRPAQLYKGKYGWYAASQSKRVGVLKALSSREEVRS